MYQRPDQYKMKLLVFSIQYDFQILKYQYQYSIWRVLNKYQYQYDKKTEVSVFSISILSGKKHEKASKPSRFEKLRLTIFTKQERPPFVCHYLQPKERLVYCLNLCNESIFLVTCQLISLFYTVKKASFCMAISSA